MVSFRSASVEYLPFCSALSDRLAGKQVGLRGFSHRGGGEQAWIRQRMLSLPGNICLISCCVELHNAAAAAATSRYQHGATETTFKSQPGKDILSHKRPCLTP